MENRKIAIVTGGSRGIGRAICVELATRGYYMVINYISNEIAANKTLEMVRDAGGDGELCCFDVSDFEKAKEIVEELAKRLDHVDVLVNNAGIAADNLFAMMSKDNWQSVISTTLDGFYNVTKPIIKKMIRKKSGSVITISSVSGLIGNKGQANYSAAKAGVIGASKSLAAEVARLGIRVNVVAPGLIETEMIQEVPLDMIKQMIPMARIGKSEEVAKVVAFLCSDDASYITGQVISVNGGMV